MRKLVCSAALLFLVPLALVAQGTPKADIFTGVSYLRLEKTNQLGWNTAIGGNINKNLAFVADISGYYNSQSQTAGGIPTDSHSSVHSVLVGPRVSEASGRWTPFAQALFGWGRLHSELSSSGGPGTSFSSTQSNNAFAVALGGGIDYKLNNATSLRVIQIDYFMLRAQSQKPQGARLSSGVVFNLGNRRE